MLPVSSQSNEIILQEHITLDYFKYYVISPRSHKHENNGFADVSKNLARYRSENNFVKQNNYAYTLMTMVQKILTF